MKRVVISVDSCEECPHCEPQKNEDGVFRGKCLETEQEVGTEDPDTYGCPFDSY